MLYVRFGSGCKNKKIERKERTFIEFLFDQFLLKFVEHSMSLIFYIVGCVHNISIGEYSNMMEYSENSRTSASMGYWG